MKKQTALRSYDIVVVGGGSAGVAASVAAARRGLRVALLESYGFCGGMATAAEVGTVCGLFHRSMETPRFIDDGFAREFGEKLAELSKSSPVRHGEGLWFLPYRPQDFKVLCDRLLQEAGVQSYFHTTVASVDRVAGRIEAVGALLRNQLCRFEANAFIDCSGEATLSHLAGATMYEEASAQAGAIIFQIGGVSADSERSIFHLLCKATLGGIHNGDLPAECRRISIVPGSMDNGRVSIKLSLPGVAQALENSMTEVERGARSCIDKLVQHWSQTASEPHASIRGVWLDHVAPQIGIRTGRRPLGKKILTEEDVLGCKKVPDAAVSCAWPIEHWGSGDGADLELLPEGDYYDIPLEVLCSGDYSNLFFAGRNISAEDRALASARVIGCCLATGFAAGEQAASIVQSRIQDDLPVEILSEVSA